MTPMSASKVSAICALVSVSSLAGAFFRGDLVCASTFTFVLILIFGSFGLAAIVSLLATLIGSLRRNDSDAEANPN